MDDFFVFGKFFDVYLKNFATILKRCKENNLLLNWEKNQFIVTNGLVVGHLVGHLVSKCNIEIDKVKIELIFQLFISKTVKYIYSFS